MFRKMADSLCSTCRFMKPIKSGKGSLFIQCQLHFSNRKFAKYPQLPVQYCLGFEAIRNESKETDRV